MPKLCSYSRVYSWQQRAHLHEKDGVKYHKGFRQGTGDVGVLVESEHARPRGHGHGLDVFHITAVRIFGVVVDAGVDPVVVERVVRVEYLEGITRMMVDGTGAVLSAPVLAGDINYQPFGDLDCTIIYDTV